MKKPEFHYPLRGIPMCGHSLGPYGLGNCMTGSEEHYGVVERKRGIYHYTANYGPCSLCNVAEHKRIKNWINNRERKLKRQEKSNG